MQHTLIWEDSFVSGVCKFKAFNNFEYMCDYIDEEYCSGFEPKKEKCK